MNYNLDSKNKCCSYNASLIDLLENAYKIDIKIHNNHLNMRPGVNFRFNKNLETSFMEFIINNDNGPESDITIKIQNQLFLVNIYTEMGEYKNIYYLTIEENVEIINMFTQLNDFLQSF